MRRYFFGLAMMALAMMSPTIARADDSQIARQIIERLQVEKKTGSLKGFSIDLQVDDGTVWMSGKLNSEEQRAKALDIARRVPGVKQVVNDLKVAGEVKKEQSISDNSADAEVPAEESTASSLLTKIKPSFWANRKDKASSESEEASAPANEIPAIKPVSNAAAIGTGLQPTQAQAAPYYTPAPARQQQPVATNRSQSPVPMGQVVNRQAQYEGEAAGPNGEPCPMYGGAAYGVGASRYDHPQMPGYSWPSYAAYPNYGAVTYPKQYSPTAWPYIGPFYPYPQVPMGWRKVSLEWDDGWWFLDFKDSRKVAHGKW